MFLGIYHDVSLAISPHYSPPNILYLIFFFGLFGVAVDAISSTSIRLSTF